MTMELNECITCDNGNSFILQGAVPFVFVSKENDKKCVVVEISNSDGLGVYKYLSSYVAALGLIASGKMSSIDLFVESGDDEKGYDEKVCHLTLDADTAKKNLACMYKNAFVKCENKILPVALLNESLSSLEELRKALDDGFGRGAWAYFGGKDLFIADLEKCSGYSAKNFSEEWNTTRGQQLELVEDLADKIK